MNDPMLAALLQPTNMLFSVARWPDGQWSIRNVSIGHVDVYKLMANIDKRRRELAWHQREIFATGAAAHEFVILRPTWNEIEEFVIQREDER